MHEYILSLHIYICVCAVVFAYIYICMNIGIVMLQYVIAGRLLLLPQESQRAQVYADRQLRDQDRKQAGRKFEQVC